MASNSRPPPPTIGSPKDLDTFAFVWKVVVALIAPSHCFIASPSPHPPQVSGNNAMDVRLVPENGNVIACLGVEYLSPQRIDPAEPQYLSVHRGFPHQPVTVHERHVHPARIGRNGDHHRTGSASVGPLLRECAGKSKCGPKSLALAVTALTRGSQTWKT